MKNLLFVLVAIVMTAGLLFGASAVNACYKVEGAAMTGDCCPSVQSTQMKSMDSGCCPGSNASGSADMAIPEHCTPNGSDTQNISSDECPTTGSCPEMDRQKSTKTQSTI